MSNVTSNAKIHKLIIDSLSKSPKNRTNLIEICLNSYGLSAEELSDNSAGSKKTA